MCGADHKFLPRIAAEATRPRRPGAATTIARRPPAVGLCEEWGTRPRRMWPSPRRAPLGRHPPKVQIWLASWSIIDCEGRWQARAGYPGWVISDGDPIAPENRGPSYIWARACGTCSKKTRESRSYISWCTIYQESGPVQSAKSNNNRMSCRVAVGNHHRRKNLNDEWKRALYY
jgi:hypothetical protein